MENKDLKSEYPESKALEIWKKDNLTLSIVKNDKHLMNHYCGYVRFPKRPLREKGYQGIATYVPAHGGITYAEKSKNGSFVYGFDCSHSGDASPLHPEGKHWTLEEVKNETEKMAKAIQLAIKYEKRYLRNISPKGKAKVIDEFHKECETHGINFNLQDNFGSMLNLLAGQI